MSELSNDIRLLGNLLGDVIRKQEGSDVFDTEEKIRGLSKEWRSGDESAHAAIADIIQKIIDDLPLTSEILKAFKTYFQLVNLAEEHQRIRVLRRRASQAFVDKTPMEESVAAAIHALKKEGMTSEQVQDALQDMLVMPVITAHPTESRRKITLRTLNHLSDTLFQFDSSATYADQVPEIEEELRDTITLLWQSDERRKRKPTVMDEVRNNGIFFFDETLFDVVPIVYEELERALDEYYPDLQMEVPSLLRFGSWIGGDRDGNPFVTLKTTEQAIRTQVDAVIGRYQSDVYELYESLSIARSRAQFNPRFLAKLKDELQALSDTEQKSLDRFAEEPYRQKLILIYRRLNATWQMNRTPWEESVKEPRAYASPSELLDDLKSIAGSLRENKGESIARGKLSRLIRRVKVFGFHLASLDIRQHSERHGEALGEIFTTYQICDDYQRLPEVEKVALLSREIQNRRPLTAQLNFSDPTNETVGLLRRVKTAHQRVGPRSVVSYVISMTESVSDVLEVVLLLRDVGLFGQLDVVPLFETIDDLRNASHIMSRLFDIPAYQQHLEERDREQQIMIGYSDSNKDGGYLAANWMLFTAQRELAHTCQEHGIGLTLFHGRGGSIGRGGGPANRAILAQPAESIRGRLRVTEQGEVISSRYRHSAIARRHLQQILHAVICSTGSRPQVDKIDRWSQIMSELSELAYDAYRRLVEHPDFIEYFQSTTPIELIGELNLGSRPAKRRATEGISDLRAIPWVFAWTQSRTDIPSWYGVGSAFRQWLEQHPENKDSPRSELQDMYQQWPYFNTLIKNVHLGLGRADLPISRLYSQLAPDGIRQPLFDMIESEFRLTQSMVLQISQQNEILDTEPWLKHSVQVRNPYVDPLNYIQVALLERLQQKVSDDERSKIQEVILQSINGVAAGLQTVG